MTIMSVEEVREEAAKRGLRVALIVTALDLELQAVTPHFMPLASAKGRDGAIYECGEFHDVGQDWLVIVAETGAGMHPAQGVVTNAHMQFEPEIQIFVGVGGSRKTDVPIGSVVAADHVYLAYPGKYDEQGFSSRPREFPAHSRLLNVARKVRRDKAWISRIRDPADGKLPLREVYPVAFPPLGHIAPAVSTEAVIASRKGDLAEMIASHCGDACIVEMEGYGAIYAAYQEQKPAIVIRGVSDMTEKKEAETDRVCQPIAACHAAAFAFELLVQWGLYYPREATSLPTIADATSPTAATDPTEKFGPTVSGATYVLNLDSDTSMLTPEKVAAIEAALREIAKEPDLRIARAEAGSLRLVVSSPTNALARLDVTRLREALGSRFALHLFGLAPEHEMQELSEIGEELRRVSGDLFSWPATLPDGEQIERPELQQLLGLSRENELSATAVIGAPGSGKSALLATLGRKLVEQGYPVLAMKADLLDANISNEADLRERLELSDRPSTLLTRLAAFGPTFLLIDQLDALASYLDLRTGRLSVLLNLVRRLGRTINVHIVMSARKFEFEHDVRLRSISAESLDLQLPGWSQVLVLLESRGVQAGSWPSDAQEVLRSPQALATYLRLGASERSEPLGSYQAMLDQLWAERVLRGSYGSARSQLAGAIADTMAEEESLWLARARYDQVSSDVEALIAAGILTQNPAGVSIGFAHQTVFDYALARSFTQEKGRLSGYVLERQSSIFVRPKVWTALTYLRATDATIYDEELRAIWGATGLRRHIRLLLIDFLGQQAAPSDREALLMEQALKARDERAVAIRAMSGSAGWFRRFSRSYFAALMSEGPPAADWVLAPLMAAWSSDPAAVIGLLKERWLHDPANDARVWGVIQRASTWFEELLDIAVTVLHRTPIAPMYVDHIVAEVGVEQPEIALELLRAALERELQFAEIAASEVAARVEPDGSSASERIMWSLRNNPREPLKRFMENSNDWESVPSLAEQAPNAFIELLWPWYIRALTVLVRHGSGRKVALGYALQHDLDFRFEGEQSRSLPEPSLLAAARTAIEKLAVEAPDAFRAWVATNDKADVAPVQRLIAHSFTIDPAAFAADALAFLSNDHRRLYLGGPEDQVGTTTRLIAAVSDHWSDTEVCAFESMIWAFKPAAPPHLLSPDGKRTWQNILRRLRFNLLRALPARRISERTRKRLQEEERALPSNRLGVTFSGVRTVGSMMSASEISRASDDNVINAFQQLPDSTGWRHPTDWEKSGNIQLSREFANFAKAEPERALRLIKRFAPEFGTRAAGYALNAMSEAASPAKLMETIVDLTGRGFDNIEFRGSIAMTVDRLVDREIKIDEAIIDLLKGWLMTPAADDPRSAELIDRYDEAEVLGEGDKPDAHDVDIRSLLWSHGGISIVASNMYPVIRALMKVYLRLRDIQKLVNVLIQALNHVPDHTCWQQILLSLAEVRPNKGDEAVAEIDIVRRILDRFPEFVGTRELAYLFGHMHWWAPDLVERELLGWRNTKARTARHGYGELVALLALLHPERTWPAIALEAIEQSLDDHDARAGAATTAVNLWSRDEHRARATKLLVRLLPNAGGGEWSAVFDVFRLVNELTPEANTIALLEAIAANMNKAPQLNSTFIVDGLETLLPHEAPLVARIADGLVRKWQDELGDTRTGTSTTAPKLVNVAVTLHRLGPATREVGIRLFEQLLDIDAYAARETLDEIDSRFRQDRALRRPRLPRRTQRQRRRDQAA